MGSLDKRIEALEKLYATGESSGLEPLAALFVAAVLAGT